MDIQAPQIPEREDDQDEAIVVLALRRQDPPNPTGSPNPDLPNLEQVSAATALTTLCVDLGFDPAVSYASVVSVTDVEQGGAITLADLAALQAGGGQPAPDPAPTDEPTDPEVAAEG